MAHSASPETSRPATACVRVALLAGRRRLDVALPAHVPLAELLPDLRALADAGGADAGQVLARVGGGHLDPSSTLDEQRVTEGDLLVLQERDAVVPLRAGHDLPALVGEVVRREHRGLDEHLRRRGHLLGAAAAGVLWAGAVLSSSPASSAVVEMVAVLGAAGSVALSGRAVRVRDPWLSSVAVSLALLHLMVAGHVLLREVSSVPGGGAGAAPGLAVGAVLLLWAPVGVREWAVAPAVTVAALGMSMGVAEVSTGSPVPISAGVVLTGIGTLLVLLAGPVRAWLVDLTLVRPQGASGADAFHAPQVAARVRSATRLALAVDVATAAVLVLAAPDAVASGTHGLALWAATVSLLALRTRGEALALRAAVGWAGTLAVALVGAGATLATRVVSSDDTLLLLVVTGTWCALVLLICVPGTAGRVASTLQVRFLAVAERMLRVALPSLWLLYSGLLPGSLR